MSYPPQIPLVQPPGAGGTLQLQQPKRPQRRGFQLSTGAIWTIGIVIIVIVILLAIFLISQQEREVIEIPAGDDILLLDDLINLEPDGLCCKPPAVATTTERWIYLPSTDITYSTDSTSADVVCQFEMGSNFDACVNNVTDENGEPAILAHKGITPYYAFAIGQPGTVCESFLPCV